MTAKPWPHEWREGMRLLPVLDMEHEPMPALLVYEVGLPHQLSKQGKLYGIDIEESPGKHWHVDSNDPRIQPDLDDDGTVGILKGMVRELLGDEWYALEPMDHVREGRPLLEWYESATGKCYATEGKAYKAALDYLRRADKAITVLIEMQRVGSALPAARPVATLNDITETLLGIGCERVE